MAMLSQPITVYHYPLSLIAAYHRLSPTKYLLSPLFPNEAFFLLPLFSPLFWVSPKTQLQVYPLKHTIS